MNALSDWKYFSVGMVREEWKGVPDGFQIDWSDACGLTLFVFFNKIRPEEKDAISARSRFEIAFKDIEGIGFFTLKFGNLPWSDCVFSPNLYQETPKFEKPESGKTYALNVMLVDTETGELKLIRVIALGKEFVKQFRAWCLASLDKNIGRRYYDRVVETAFTCYPSSSSIAEEADFRWVLPSNSAEHAREDRELME